MVFTRLTTSKNPKKRNSKGTREAAAAAIEAAKTSAEVVEAKMVTAASSDRSGRASRKETLS